MSLWSPLMMMFYVFLLLLFSAADASLGYGAKKQNFSVRKHGQTQQLSNPSCISKSRRENGAAILEMKHKDYCSGQTHENMDLTLQKRLITDDFHVRSLQSHIKNMVSSHQNGATSQTKIPLTSGVKLQILNYIVTVTLGGRNMTVIVDTGSDLTWVQCQPCRLCYNQIEPLFNPSQSPLYQSVSCNSPTCQSLISATGYSGTCGSNGSSCNYIVSYGDGSYTRGDLSKDHLVLGTTPVENFVFGCGRSNRGLFGSVSGLMGLGRSDLSMVSQTFDVFGGVFSYCLPSTDPGSSGSLAFGNDSSVFKNSTPISYTGLIQNPQLSTFYLLNLTGATLGGVALQDPNFGQKQILIDSGTVISRLPPSIYRAVKSEFLRQFSGYPLAPGFSILDTCFDLSKYQEVDIPTLKMQFEGDAELIVDVSGMFYFAKNDASQVCLALASLAYDDEIGIIGNYQQRNTRVIYDTKQSKVGFARESCSFM